MDRKPIFKDEVLKEDDIYKAIESIYEGANLLVDKPIDTFKTKIYQYKQDQRGLITAYVYIASAKTRFIEKIKFDDDKQVELSLRKRFKDGYSFVIG